MYGVQSSETDGSDEQSAASADNTCLRAPNRIPAVIRNLIMSATDVFQSSNTRASQKDKHRGCMADSNKATTAGESSSWMLYYIETSI